MADVLDFTGNRATPPGEAVPEVVTAIELLLEAARAGQVIAVAYATVEPGGIYNSGYAWGADPIRGTMIGSVSVLNQRILAKLGGIEE